MEKCILVLHDFTEVGDYAIEHAYTIGKVTKTPIHILHVVKNTNELESAKEKLKHISEKYNKNNDVEIVVDTRKGNLFKEVYKYGLDINAHLAVMGTHGIKNVRKAMKVVKKFVKIPFILVQNPVSYGDYSKILVPLDTDKSSRIKTQWIRYMNTLFESKAFIFAHNMKDKYKAKDLATNIRFVQDVLDNELIDYEVKYINSGKNFGDEMYSFANEIGADTILVMAHKYRDYIKALKKVENIELYKKIPIMCVNKRTDINKVGGFN